MKLNNTFGVCLLVEDFEKSKAFYNKTMGFEINYEDKNYAEFKLRENGLSIFGKKGAIGMFSKKYMNNGGGFVLALQVANLEKYNKELKEKSIEVIEGPKTTAWGQKVLYFLDPDKNVIEVSEKEEL